MRCDGRERIEPPNGNAGDSSWRGWRAQTRLYGCPVFGRLRFSAAGPLPNRSNEREVALCAVASSVLRPSRVFYSAAILNNRFGCCSLLCPEGEQFERRST